MIINLITKCHVALQSAYLTASKEKEQQLKAELDTMRRKAQQISMLEQELQAKQENVREQFEQIETEILEQKGEQNGLLLGVQPAILCSVWFTHVVC